MKLLSSFTYMNADKWKEMKESYIAADKKEK